MGSHGFPSSSQFLDSFWSNMVDGFHRCLGGGGGFSGENGKLEGAFAKAETSRTSRVTLRSFRGTFGSR